MARVLFPPPDPQDLGTTRKSAAASKSRPAGSLPWGGGDNSCGACPPPPAPAAGPGPPLLSAHPTTQHQVSPERQEALEVPKQPDSALDLLCDHKHTAVPLWASSSCRGTRAEAPVFSGSKRPRRSCIKDKVLRGLGVRSKEPPAPAPAGPLHASGSPLPSLLPPAQSRTVAPTSNSTGKDAWGEEASHPSASLTEAPALLKFYHDRFRSFTQPHGTCNPQGAHSDSSPTAAVQLSLF